MEGGYQDTRSYSEKKSIVKSKLLNLSKIRIFFILKLLYVNFRGLDKLKH